MRISRSEVLANTILKVSNWILNRAFIYCVHTLFKNKAKKAKGLLAIQWWVSMWVGQNKSSTLKPTESLSHTRPLSILLRSGILDLLDQPHNWTVSAPVLNYFLQCSKLSNFELPYLSCLLYEYNCKDSKIAPVKIKNTWLTTSMKINTGGCTKGWFS